MISYLTGDLFEAPDDVLVNPVNCLGSMGSGLAKRFKEIYPDNFTLYQEVCERKALRPGVLHIVTTEFIGFPKWIINFPTKRDWRDPSRLEDIADGLILLNSWASQTEVRSVALPRLGCGLGRLEWWDVRRLIETHLRYETDWHVYAQST